jgi:hypothetical protein
MGRVIHRQSRLWYAYRTIDCLLHPDDFHVILNDGCKVSLLRTTIGCAIRLLDLNEFDLRWCFGSGRIDGYISLGAAIADVALSWITAIGINPFQGKLLIGTATQCSVGFKQHRQAVPIESPSNEFEILSLIQAKRLKTF